MINYYLCTQPELPILEEEQKVCERTFGAMRELVALFDSQQQPDIEDHVAIKKLGERIAELSLIVHDGLLNCLEYEKNTFYPRVVLLPAWAEAHDMFCQFAVDWCAKYSIYTRDRDKEARRRIPAKKEDKLLSGYIKYVNNPDSVFSHMCCDEDIAMICDTVCDSLMEAGVQMCAAEKYAVISDEYRLGLHSIVDDAMQILAYGIQCFMGMLVRLEKKTPQLETLGERGHSSVLWQYERYQDKYGQQFFMEILRSFDVHASENNLPHITKNKWKKYAEMKLVEISGNPIGRECVKGLRTQDDLFPITDLESALCGCVCSMDEFYAFMKLYFQYEISRDAYKTAKCWEKEDKEKLNALEFYSRIKTGHYKIIERNGKKTAIAKQKTNLKVVTDTYTYRWLKSEENRIGKLFQYLQTNAKWIGENESPDNFNALFRGEPKEFHIEWCGTKQHLFHLFKIIFERGLVTWGRKNGQWLILQNHFKDKGGHEFSSFNGEKESIKARATLERLVDIIDPSVRKH